MSFIHRTLYRQSNTYMDSEIMRRVKDNIYINYLGIEDPKINYSTSLVPVDAIHKGNCRNCIIDSSIENKAIMSVRKVASCRLYSVTLVECRLYYPAFERKSVDRWEPYSERL